MYIDSSVHLCTNNIHTNTLPTPNIYYLKHENLQKVNDGICNIIKIFWCKLSYV